MTITMPTPLGTSVTVERFPDQSAVAYCGRYALVLAEDDPAVNAVAGSFPWSVCLYDDDDTQVVVFVAERVDEAAAIFTGLAGHLAAWDGSRSWPDHVDHFLNPLRPFAHAEGVSA
jgi:hypothetical protein